MQVKRQKTNHLNIHQRKLLKTIEIINLPTSVLQIVVKLVLPDTLYECSDRPVDECLDVYLNFMPYVDLFIPGFKLIMRENFLSREYYITYGFDRIPICVLKDESSRYAFLLYYNAPDNSTLRTFAYKSNMYIFSSVSEPTDTIMHVMKRCHEFKMFVKYNQCFEMV